MEKINNNENALRKQILELGPLVLFFIGNYFLGILWGTGILVFATLISISASWFIDKKIPLMALFGCAAVVFFGVLTLIFDRDVALKTGSEIGVFLFIKIKPTVVSLLIGLSLIVTDFMGYNPLKSIMSSGLNLSPKGWKNLTRLWVIMFISMALANELAWRNLTTDDWVSFKAFGIPILSIVFAVFSIPVIRKYNIEED
ncbi:MAG: inner membrane-spanning protein YciB [Candidatus Puniceispirillales bacterium]